MTQELQAEVRMKRGYVSPSGAISGITFPPMMKVSGTRLVATAITPSLAPDVPTGTFCSINTDDRRPANGALVVAAVTMHRRPLRGARRRLVRLAQNVPLLSPINPQPGDKTVYVLRRLERNSSSGAVSLHASEPLPPIEESRLISIRILGTAHPDLEREARFALARERHAVILGYRRTAPDSGGGFVQLALERVAAEEIAEPDIIPNLARSLLYNRDKPNRALSLFREDESEQLYGSRVSAFPVDKLCARFFRAGQLSRRLRSGQSAIESFTLLHAEELLDEAPLAEIVQTVSSSPRYLEAIRQYDSEEVTMVWDSAGAKLPLPPLLARMFRAGQLSDPEEAFHHA